MKILLLYLAFNLSLFSIALIALEVRWYLRTRRSKKRNQEADKWFNEHPSPDEFPIDELLK